MNEARISCQMDGIEKEIGDAREKWGEERIYEIEGEREKMIEK